MKKQKIWRELINREPPHAHITEKKIQLEAKTNKG
jgi:hypothetical protein